MQIREVGSRGVLFTFDDLSTTEYDCTTNVYLIDGNHHIFICDTYLGPAVMEKIVDYIQANLEWKPIVVFNSHRDWDHIWGNCYFHYTPIIAHQSCREMIIRDGEIGLKEHQEMQQGDVEIVLPNLTFDKRINFPEDGVEFYYTPGHTIDSASCLDQVDKILFAGDNVEEPHPYLQYDNLDRYITTLKEYLELDIEAIIPGHGEISDKDLVKRNIAYINEEISKK